MQQLQLKNRERGRPQKKWRDKVDEDLNKRNKKQACNGQRPSGMDEDNIGCQCPQWTIVLGEEAEEEEKREDKEKEKNENEEEKKKQKNTGT